MGQVVRVHSARDTKSVQPVDLPAREGWREGKPAEDPQKTKQWGWVTAKPSEYLVHVRKGKVREKSSGQGATCFKRPRDAVAVIPTSLQRLQFQADQVTLEKVGVEVTGLAVFRIAEPLLAYRVLNFSYPERAQQKLQQTLTEMFIGATRRLIANLSVEDCLQKRKSALAQELIVEVSPVVGGNGKPSDTTSGGWGVVIDTIEIQEVRVLSENVFSAMQAPYRAALDQKARLARADSDETVAERESQKDRAIEEARIASEMAVREKRANLERAEAEGRRAAALRQSEIEREVEEAKVTNQAAIVERQLAVEAAQARKRSESKVEEQRLAQEVAEAELHVYDALVQAQKAKHQLARGDWEHYRDEQNERAELTRVEGLYTAQVALEQAKAEKESAEARAQLVTAEKLPQLASAVGERMGEVNITSYGGENPLGSVAQGVHALLDLAKSVR